MHKKLNKDAVGKSDTDRTETQVMTLRVPLGVYDAMRILSFVSGKSLNEIGLKAIQNYLADEGHREQVDALLTQAKEQYQVALDKLADL